MSLRVVIVNMYGGHSPVKIIGIIAYVICQFLMQGICNNGAVIIGDHLVIGEFGFYLRKSIG